MRRSRFTQEEITQLITEVKRHPCLWNKGNENYNKIFHVGTAWKTIARQTGRSETTIKLKWKNLRDTFKRMVSKNPESTINYKGDWPYFDQMLFLLSSRPPRKRDRPIETQLQETDNNDEEFVIFSVHNPEDEDSSPKRDVLPHSEDYYDLLFLESLAPYFQRLEPVRRVAMRAKIQDMLMRDILDAQNAEVISQDDE